MSCHVTTKLYNLKIRSTIELYIMRNINTYINTEPCQTFHAVQNLLTVLVSRREPQPHPSFQHMPFSSEIPTQSCLLSPPSTSPSQTVHPSHPSTPQPLTSSHTHPLPPPQHSNNGSKTQSAPHRPNQQTRCSYNDPGEGVDNKSRCKLK